MANLDFPPQYTRAGNTTHNNEVHSIPQDEQFAYGTEMEEKLAPGFRFRAEKLPFIVYRCAYLASLLARHLDAAIGVMITASHNPAQDNGVKLVNFNGDRITRRWEIYADQVINASDADLPKVIRDLEKNFQRSSQSKIASGLIDNAKVVCGIDTRVSGPHLMEAARAGAALFNVKFVDIGVVSTPMLHYIVKSFNEPEFAEATHQGYYQAISDAFRKLYTLTPEPKGSRYQPELIVDCANGVGAPRFRELLELIPKEMLRVEFRNENGELNHGCGADFVKIRQNIPAGFDSEAKEPKCASFDGDADRILYFRAKKGYLYGKAELFDGDRIAVLFAKYLKEQLDIYTASKPRNSLKMGIVQTAYANGSSTRFIREHLKIEPIIAPTGVKRLQRNAAAFDIGVYFETNGHGTIVFSKHFDSVVRRNTDSLPTHLQRLHLFSRVINETVGDAFADLLATEIVLRHFGWSMDDWMQKLYEDTPSISFQASVGDLSIFKTTNAEQTLEEPDGLQKRIDEEVAKYKNARAFARPSGTENIVRVYAEADTLENAHRLGETVTQAVEQADSRHRYLKRFMRFQL
ncbi:hypothetical protein B9Z55_013814 [Caenorhabditis nigoni]|nr:hypothetical protein B9Z55_013814 [Caenorhabditis nigoni]